MLGVVTPGIPPVRVAAFAVPSYVSPVGALIVSVALLSGSGQPSAEQVALMVAPSTE